MSDIRESLRVPNECECGKPKGHTDCDKCKEISKVKAECLADLTKLYIELQGRVEALEKRNRDETIIL